MKKASISLTTVLVIGAMLLLAGITLITTSLDLMSATASYADQKIARINANTCLEEAMARIKINQTYTGTGELFINNGSCTYTVTNYQSDPTRKQIDLSGALNGTNYSTSKLANLNVSPIDVTSLI